MTIRMIDPGYCSCTDCLTGRSRPLDSVDMDDLDQLIDDVDSGKVRDRTGMSDSDWDDYLTARRG
jgi:hypothetical protein